MPNIYNSSAVVLGGGGGETDGYKIRYFDVDGTILKTEYVKEGGKLTPPDNPTYDSEYLSFYEWNYDINNYIVERDTDVGAIYRTKTGDTYLFIKLTENIGLTIPSLSISGATSIDWGDGTINSSLIHTYADYGEYVIKISGMTGTTSYLFGANTSTYNYCLQKCYLGNNVTSMADYTFRSCSSLKSIIIPNSVTSMADYTFSSCYSLKSITIPNSVTSLGDSVFYYCYSLTNAIIPNSVTSLGTAAFSYCASLINAIIPNSVTSLGDSAFSNCYSLINATIPNNITNIENSTFVNCYSLKSITLPNNVTNIGNFVFHSCYSLTNAIIPNSVTSLGSSIFQKCYALKDITIPNNLTNIGNDIFNACHSLTSVTIPNDVTNIGSNAFDSCFSITNYIFNCDSVPTLSNTKAFNKINKSAIIWVKDELVDAYKSAENWSTYANYIKPLSQYNAD